MTLAFSHLVKVAASIAVTVFVAFGALGATGAKAAAGDPINATFNYAGLNVDLTLAQIDELVLTKADTPVSIAGTFTDGAGNFTLPKETGLTFPDVSLNLGDGVNFDTNIALEEDGSGNYNESTGVMTMEIPIALTIGVSDVAALPIPGLGSGPLSCEFAPISVSLSTAAGWPHAGSAFANPATVENGALAGAWRSKPAATVIDGAQATCDLIAGVLKPVGGLWLANSSSDIVTMPESTQPKPLQARSASIDSGPPGTTVSSTASFTFSSEPALDFECSLDAAQWEACDSPHTISPVSEGTHTFRVRAMYSPGVPFEPAATRSWTVDSTTLPTASLSASAEVVQTGQEILLDASTSTDHADGFIVGYDWDLDGNGIFETSSAGGQIRTSYDQIGFVDPAVRVTNDSGKNAVASQRVEVRLAPPAGPLGVSVNGGAQYTNDPNVEIWSVWPMLATGMLVSNDGGFVTAKSRKLAAKTPWRLDSSGPERLPKTIYIRFVGGSSGPETYQDDIILDETPPVLKSSSASLQGGSASQSLRSAAAASGKKKATVVLRTRVSDRTSGVSRMQVGKRKSNTLKKLPYRKTLRLKPAKRLWVRIFDRAGNASRWKSVKVKG